MRKIIIVVVMTSIFSLYAITPTVTIGVQNGIIANMEQGNFYVDITLIQPIGNLNLYGNYRNEMDFSRWKPLRFAPKQDYFTVGASYDMGFATIRAEHMCMHPVVSNSYWNGLQGGYTRFEIQIGD
jgi:hypothetical protein